MTERVVVCIDAPHFAAAVVLVDGVVIQAAPILGWTVGVGRRRLWEAIKRRGWEVVGVYRRQV